MSSCVVLWPLIALAGWVFWQPRAPWCDGCIRLVAHSAQGQTASASIVFVEPSIVSDN
jgi:hypothetical protein